LAAACVISIAPTASAGHDYYGACVLAERGARLYSLYANRWCDDCCCRRPAWRHVRAGRAFRVEDQQGGYVLVSHREARGWIPYRHVRFAHEAFCRAAGM
jgi:hypothetical protein